MSDINTDILNGLIIGRVEPHIYAFSTRTMPDYLKIGDTYRPVEKRLEEWRKYFPNLERHFSDIAKADAETFFRDFAVHHFLERDKGKVRLQRDMIDSLPYYSNEFFKDTEVRDIEEAIADIKQSHIGNNGKYQFYRFDESRIPIDYKWKRKEKFEPRPNQQVAIDSFKKAIGEGRTNLLMYAVMRFGKSFTSMCCAIEMNARFVVIVSAKADVKAEWKKTIESHTKFEEFEFLDNNSLIQSESAITNRLKEGKVALFLTLQDLQGEKIKEKHKEVFDTAIDLLLIDETHYGARASEFGRVLEGLSKSEQESELKQYEDDSEDFDETVKRFDSKIRIHLSGTPYRILMGSEFTKDDIISFCQFTDIVAEQEKWNDENLNKDEVKEWDNPYYGFPQMVRFAFDPNAASIKKIKELKKSGISSAFNELLRPESIRKSDRTQKHKKFKYENEILDLFEIIDGSKSDDNLLGFLDYDKIKQGKMCRHIVCVLPYRASCDALEELIKSNLEKFKNLNQYEIINIAGVDNERTYKEVKNVKDKIESCERKNNKTLTLTVNRMLTGSTVKEWDTMIYLKDTSSPQEYDQAIFRLQNQYITTYKDENGNVIKYNMKPQTLLVDFAPDRMFCMQEQKSQIYNANVEKNGNDKLEDRIRQELEISPIIRLNHNKIQQVTPTDILSAISEYSSQRSVADEANAIPVDFSLLDDANIRAEIERQAEINSREGLKTKVVQGKGEDIDTPEATPTDGDAPDETVASSEPPKTKKDEAESIRKKFATYYSRILFFAFLTQSSVKNLNDIITAIDADNDNKRIAKNIGLNKDILVLFKQKMNPFILSKLDYKIQNLNRLANDTSLKALNRAINALKKFGRLSDSEVVTPAKITNDIVAILPEEGISDQTKFLDIAAKQGEFTIALYKRFGEMVKPNIYSAVTSSVAYEFTHKIYEMLGMPIENIFDKFNSYDIIEANNEAIIKKLDDMKFNVVVGNPPYHEDNGGGMGSSGHAIYDEFVTTARHLNPQYINMIIPSRWLTVIGGKLAAFRSSMINNNKIRILHDFIDPSDCFNNVELKGGVCYFLWDKDYNDICEIHTHNKNSKTTGKRYMKEAGLDFFVRNEGCLSILRKVLSFKERRFSSIVSANDPFGFDIRVSGTMRRKKIDYKLIPFDGCCKFYYNGWRRKGIGYIDPKLIRKNKDLANKPKVLIPKAWGTGNSLTDWLNPFIADKNSCCYETYLVVGPFESNNEAKNAISYTQTRFFHLIVSILKSTQNVMQGAYDLVPMQDFSKPWTDAELYAKYDLTEDEIAFIESTIKPMK